MDARTVRHRGPVATALVRGLAASLPHSVVDVGIRDLQNERDEESALAYESVDVAVTTAKLRDYMACGDCGKRITVEDVRHNACSHCGEKIMDKW